MEEDGREGEVLREIKDKSEKIKVYLIEASACNQSLQKITNYFTDELTHRDAGKFDPKNFYLLSFNFYLIEV